MSTFDPEKELDNLGIPVEYLRLQDVLAEWDAEHGKVYCNIGLTPVLKRCALAHELAHIKLEHSRCAFSDGVVTSVSSIQQERSAEMWASRQLISVVQLAIAKESRLPYSAVAREFGVTERMYRARLLAEIQDEERWLGGGTRFGFQFLPLEAVPYSDTDPKLT
ncbi:ImmA/IrrE family metallo-endopeptidase [Streptomyces murinus]|uniref:ImmA/IrrE family metallo-endopeptidase n=1 Tax=Streptomyces murinus TaxID=33900 RepID=UPI003827F846